MPELPEVETIRRQLTRTIVKKRIEEVIVYDSRLVKCEVKKFIRILKGARIEEVRRIGKVLVIQLDRDEFLVIHLRISGWLILSKNEEKFSRVVFIFDDGQRLSFCDQRALGHIQVTDDLDSLPLIKEMGIDALSIKENEFIRLIKSRKIKIKPLLMDQKFIAGIGNVYAQESLFCAGINPLRLANELDDREIKSLYRCLKDILTEAIKQKGSSVDTYRQINGEEGGYVPFLKVYQREGQPCVRCKTPIKRVVIGGRGTYFCKKCQK